jgi:hypothetical protein
MCRDISGKRQSESCCCCASIRPFATVVVRQTPGLFGAANHKAVVMEIGKSALVLDPSNL